MLRFPWTPAGVATAMLLATAACTGKQPPASAADSLATATPSPREIVVRARDMAFTAPADIPAGRVTFRFINDGPDLHHLQLLRLEQGKTFADLTAALKEGGIPPWVTFVGGPNLAHNPAGSVGTLDLEAGDYALICFIDTPDFVPHFVKGMMQPLTVTPAVASASTPLPPADLTITLSDYAFTLSDSLHAGPLEIDVIVDGQQPHELVLLRFEPGKGMRDLAEWSTTLKGPLPAAGFGGTSAISPGHRQRVSVNLEPGSYALICFVPDATDKKPHVEHGMVQLLTIN